MHTLTIKNQKTLFTTMTRKIRGGFKGLDLQELQKIDNGTSSIPRGQYHEQPTRVLNNIQYIKKKEKK
jgi:hypothetical protein